MESVFLKIMTSQLGDSDLVSNQIFFFPLLSLSLSNLLLGLFGSYTLEHNCFDLYTLQSLSFSFNNAHH